MIISAIAAEDYSLYLVDELTSDLLFYKSSKTNKWVHVIWAHFTEKNKTLDISTPINDDLNNLQC